MDEYSIVEQPDGYWKVYLLTLGADDRFQHTYVDTVSLGRISDVIALHRRLRKDHV